MNKGAKNNTLKTKKISGVYSKTIKTCIEVDLKPEHSPNGQHRKHGHQKELKGKFEIITFRHTILKCN